jgi:threonine dehydrogenase-like Zn-dependent dehydrogenase
MPRKIIARQGPTFHLVEYDLPPPGALDVRIAVEFAAPKHGTEIKGLTSSPFSNKRWDPELRLFLLDESDPAPAAPLERNVGNMVVGMVIEAGEEVSRFQAGDRVFGYEPICDFHQAPEHRFYPLGDLKAVDAVCIDPAHVAFVAIRDGNVRIGDDVVVYGLGAIGLMAVQIARAAGARRVFGVDPIAIRRAYAKAHGADAAFDPLGCDAALEIKRATERAGVDVALDTSGNSRALHDAIRAIRQCGVVVAVAFGPHDNSHLHLDEEFHHNRPTIIGSQAWSGWENPDRSHPLWTHERAYDATIDLFRRGLLTGVGVVTPIVPIADAPEALTALLSVPETTIKLGVSI